MYVHTLHVTQQYTRGMMKLTKRFSLSLALSTSISLSPEYSHPHDNMIQLIKLAEQPSARAGDNVLYI